MLYRATVSLFTFQSSLRFECVIWIVSETVILRERCDTLFSNSPNGALGEACRDLIMRLLKEPSLWLTLKSEHRMEVHAIVDGLWKPLSVLATRRVCWM